DDIVRPLDPSTSETCRYDPPTSQCRIPYSEFDAVAHDRAQRRRDRLLGVNPPGFAEFLEALTLVSVTNDNPRTQLNLWRDYNRVQKRFAELGNTKIYLEAIQRYAKELDRNVNQWQRIGLDDTGHDELEELVLYCVWSHKRDQRKDELK
ncbi:40882_t:CDS:1, partial [Gigaspora margarita]